MKLKVLCLLVLMLITGSKVFAYSLPYTYTSALCFYQDRTDCYLGQPIHFGIYKGSYPVSNNLLVATFGNSPNSFDQSVIDYWFNSTNTYYWVLWGDQVQYSTSTSDFFTQFYVDSVGNVLLSAPTINYSFSNYNIIYDSKFRFAKFSFKNNFYISNVPYTIKYHFYNISLNKSYDDSLSIKVPFFDASSTYPLVDNGSYVFYAVITDFEGNLIGQTDPYFFTISGLVGNFNYSAYISSRLASSTGLVISPSFDNPASTSISFWGDWFQYCIPLVGFDAYKCFMGAFDMTDAQKTNLKDIYSNSIDELFNAFPFNFIHSFTDPIIDWNYNSNSNTVLILSGTLPSFLGGSDFRYVISSSTLSWLWNATSTGEWSSDEGKTFWETIRQFYEPFLYIIFALWFLKKFIKIFKII